MTVKTCPVPESFKSMFWNILFLTLVFFLTFISRFIFSPLLPVISEDLHISSSQAGSIFLIGSFGLFIGAFFSGFISSRINHRGALILSLCSAAAALILCVFMSSLAAIRTAMFILGIAAGFNLPSVIAVITAMVSTQDWGKALALQQTAPPFSLILGPLLTVFFLLFFPWQAIMGTLAVSMLIVAFLLFRIIKMGDFPGDSPKLSLAGSILSRRSFWIMIVLFALGIGCQSGVYSMLPLFLVTERGMNADAANTITGLAQISALFMTFFGGWMVDRIGLKKSIAIFLAASGIVTILLGLVTGPWLTLMVFLQPALIACYFPAGFASLSRIVQPDQRSLATSWVTPTGFIIGGGLLPAGLGYMGQAYTIGLGISLAGLVMVLLFPLTFGLHLIEKLDEGC